MIGAPLRCSSSIAGRRPGRRGRRPATSRRRVRPVVHLAGAQPEPDRHREAQLGPVQHMGGHDGLQRAAQRVLRGGPGDLLVERQPRRHGEHLGVEERHPQLQRVGHRHLVGLDQDVAAQPGEQVDVLHPGHRVPALRLRVRRGGDVGVRQRRGTSAAPRAAGRRGRCGRCRSSAPRGAAPAAQQVLAAHALRQRCRDACPASWRRRPRQVVERRERQRLPVDRVAAEQLVGALAGQHDLDVVAGLPAMNHSGTSAGSATGSSRYQTISGSAAIISVWLTSW